MNREEAGSKNVIVHVGPHKTGTTSIQNWLDSHREYLGKHDILFLHTSETHKIAKLLISENFLEARIRLEQLAATVTDANASTVIISQEDFAGDLPGRSKKRGIYPRLAKNLRIIEKSLKPHNVTFVFFTRPELDWMRSCYHQNLIMRTQYSSFSDFVSYFGDIHKWNEVLQKAESLFGDSLRVVEYNKTADHGVLTLLSIAGIDNPVLPNLPFRANLSPPEKVLPELEWINRQTAFPPTAWFAKRLVMNEWSPKGTTGQQQSNFMNDERSASIALPQLLKRTKSRVAKQDVEDLLPDCGVELRPLAHRILPLDVERPTVSRARMSDQSRILDYHFRGKSELAHLNALLISYLRRDTNLTPRASHLFHRTWRECGVLLISELSTRWLISTLQTFLDHGENEAQRLIGTCGYFYANLLKIYEGERSIEGFAQDGALSGTEPTTPSKFRGLDRYCIGGTDLLLNVNALALEISLRDEVAGLVLQEFLLRVKNSGNAFTRSDATRIRYGVSVEGFQDVWSFFVQP